MFGYDSSPCVTNLLSFLAAIAYDDDDDVYNALHRDASWAGLIGRTSFSSVPRSKRVYALPYQADWLNSGSINKLVATPAYRYAKNLVGITVYTQ